MVLTSQSLHPHFREPEEGGGQAVLMLSSFQEGFLDPHIKQPHICYWSDLNHRLTPNSIGGWFWEIWILAGQNIKNNGQKDVRVGPSSPSQNSFLIFSVHINE